MWGWQRGMGDPFALEQRLDEVVAPGANRELARHERGDRGADLGGARAGADPLDGVVQRSAMEVRLPGIAPIASAQMVITVRNPTASTMQTAIAAYPW